jgi:hypothetical protein
MPIYDGEGRKKLRGPSSPQASTQTKTRKSPKIPMSAAEDPAGNDAEASNSDSNLFSMVFKNVESATGDSTVWMAKQAKFNKLRMRMKKAKTFPFVGCSNIRMPTAEIKIRKLKAALMNVIFGIRPVVSVTPSPAGTMELAKKIEKWIDHLIMEKINLKPKATMAIDQELESGFFLLKPYWRCEINRRQEKFDLDDVSLEEAMYIFDGQTSPDMVKEYLVQKFSVDMNDWVAEENQETMDDVAQKVMMGKNEFTFYVQDVLYNAPDVALIEPEHVYVPVDSKVDPQEAQWLVHEFFMPIQQVEHNGRMKGWDTDGITAIKSYVNYDTRSLKDTQKDFQEGINRLNGPTNCVRIWEYYGWYDLDGDGVKEKVVITSAPDFKKVMRKIGLPFDNGKFPFVKLYYELTSDRWYAHRGIPELVEDIIKEIDVQHNMKIDSQTIRNAPMFVYRAGMVNPNLVQMIPNQGIPVNGMQPLTDSIQVLNAHNPNVEFSYKDEQMILETKVEEMTGQIDYSLQSMINKRQPRTLGEVDFQNQAAQNVFSLDADMNREQFAELFNMIWDLWCQYGSDEEEFSYFGQNGWEKIKLSKEEIQGKYKVTVRGNDQNTNPQVKLMKAQQVIQAITNPVLIQAGVIQPQQMAQGLKRFFQTLDVEGWEDFVNMDAQPAPPPPPAAIIKPDFKVLTDMEQMQIIQSAGVQPDPQGRMLRKQDELHEQMNNIQQPKTAPASAQK